MAKLSILSKKRGKVEIKQMTPLQLLGFEKMREFSSHFGGVFRVIVT
jgi:hypothetical protein